jgi:hypothetical protein
MIYGYFYNAITAIYCMASNDRIVGQFIEGHTELICTGAALSGNTKL